jgi:nucleoside-triphosphatase THEP1
MGKKDKKKKKGFGVEKTTAKTEKKLAAKQKKMIQKLGEVKVQLSKCKQILKTPFSGRYRDNCVVFEEI